MCGIAGAVFWDANQERDPVAVVRRMTDALAHRGPDGQGLVVAASGGTVGRSVPGAVLGHRRLAIIDLSERAAQPMTSAAQPITLTFNGEIYNFREIRRELESLGRRFRSDSDSEVILQGYEQWGEQIAERLRGMFAFAIWDGRSNGLLLVRDRLGIKPLYVYRTAGRLLFASEVRSLLASGLVPPRLDLQALDQFLAYQSVPPPRTLIKDIEMLAPGESAWATAGDRFARRTYWDLLTCPRHEVPIPATTVEAQDQVTSLLAESATLHLVSDVPVGVFLSGGIDSTAIAALLRQQGVTPQTFAVTFPGTALDEARHAREAASACGADHTEIPLDEQHVLALMRRALESVDHPSGDGMNSFIVSSAVREAGVKVALSGLGGDEFFGGYPSFDRLDRMAAYGWAWRRTPAPVRRAAGAAVRTLGRRSIVSAKAAALVETDGMLPQTFPILRQLFSAEQRRAVLAQSVPVALRSSSGDPYIALLDEAVRRRPDLDTMALVSYAEARTYMHDVLLRDTDQMSMHHGLEVRVPLLDHRLVEYLMALPQWVKRSRAGPKPLLVDSVGAMLPASCVQRPKQGFVLPFDSWMRGALRPFCEHHLGPEGLSGRDVFQPGGVKAIWESFLRGESTWSRPWTLVALNAWMERTGVSL